jgi:hypothetical protein
VATNRARTSPEKTQAVLQTGRRSRSGVLTHGVRLESRRRSPSANASAALDPSRSGSSQATTASRTRPSAAISCGRRSKRSSRRRGGSFGPSKPRAPPHGGGSSQRCEGGRTNRPRSRGRRTNASSSPALSAGRVGVRLATSTGTETPQALSSKMRADTVEASFLTVCSLGVSALVTC